MWYANFSQISQNNFFSTIVCMTECYYRAEVNTITVWEYLAIEKISKDIDIGWNTDVLISKRLTLIHHIKNVDTVKSVKSHEKQSTK